MLIYANLYKIFQKSRIGGGYRRQMKKIFQFIESED
jgi:hypothetical protein